MAPTVGPATGPKIIPIDHILIAKPCFSRGYVSNIMACEIGSSGAETKPCNILNNTNSVSVLDVPASNEVTVKPTIDAKKI